MKDLPREASSGARRHAIGIGAQKCASSWLFDALGAHPDVALAGVKEVDFFSYHHDRGQRWYRARFDGISGKLAFENSPSYLHDPRSPDRARRFDPQMRIVVTLRDPVERAFSHHLHEIARGHIAPMAFDTALADNPDYLEQGYYARHLEGWITAFGRDRVLCLFAEDLRADPARGLERLWRFLDLDPIPAGRIATARRNVSDRARLPVLRRLLRVGGTGLRQVGLAEPLEGLKTLPPLARVLRWNSLDLRAEVPVLPISRRIELAEMFETDMLALCRLLGRRDLPWPSWTLRQRDRTADAPRLRILGTVRPRGSPDTGRDPGG